MLQSLLNRLDRVLQWLGLMEEPPLPSLGRQTPIVLQLEEDFARDFGAGSSSQIVDGPDDDLDQSWTGWVDAENELGDRGSRPWSGTGLSLEFVVLDDPGDEPTANSAG